MSLTPTSNYGGATGGRRLRVTVIVVVECREAVLILSTPFHQEKKMADDGSKDATEKCSILKGPDGALYCISDENLKSHRIPDEEATAVRKVYENRVAGTEKDPRGRFEILGRGPVVRRTLQTVPTADGWFDLI